MGILLSAAVVELVVSTSTGTSTSTGSEKRLVLGEALQGGPRWSMANADEPGWQRLSCLALAVLRF